jgi:hypothetical protein
VSVLAIAYPAFALLLVALTVFGIVRAWARTPLRRAAAAVPLGAWLVALLFMTMRPAGSAVRLNLVPDLGGADFSAFDTLANVAVFLPLGLILAAAGWRALPAIGLGVAVSLCVEAAQYIVDVGRAADINDAITNTAGTALGWAIAWAIRAGRREKAPQRARS